MNKTSKTKPAVGTAGLGNGARQSNRYLDYNLLALLKQLPSGKRISMSDLAAARGCSERGLRARIEALRRAGIPVLSSTKKGESGYWLDPAPLAVEEWKTRTVRRAVKIIHMAHAVQAVQLDLWGDDNEHHSEN